MLLQINGKRQNIEGINNSESITITKLLEIIKVKPETVAIEIDNQVIDREHWNNFQLDSQKKIEILKFVGGG